MAVRMTRKNATRAKDIRPPCLGSCPFSLRERVRVKAEPLRVSEARLEAGPHPSPLPEGEGVRDLILHLHHLARRAAIADHFDEDARILGLCRRVVEFLELVEVGHLLPA